MAIQAGKLGKNKDAIALWKRLIELQPNIGKSYINLSSNYGKLKRYREAREAAQMAIKLSPDIKEGHLNLGMSELHLGNFKRAENVFSKLTNKYNHYYSAVFLRGASQLCQGKTKKGIKTLQSLRETSIGKSLSFAVQELAESLMAAGCAEASGNLIGGADKLNSRNDGILEHRRQRATRAA
jgi:tetratricopeptide (TPR) repeat protein